MTEISKEKLDRMWEHLKERMINVELPLDAEWNLGPVRITPLIAAFTLGGGCSSFLLYVGDGARHVSCMMKWENLERATEAMSAKEFKNYLKTNADLVVQNLRENLEGILIEEGFSLEKSGCCRRRKKRKK
jgi:hypothetical protein